MKSLSIEQMECIEGGDNCGTLGNIIGTIGWAAGIASLFTPAGAIVTVILATQGAAFGTVGTTMGWLC